MKLNDQQVKALDLIDKMQVEYILSDTDDYFYQHSHTIHLKEDLGFELSCIYSLEPKKLNSIYQYLAIDMLSNKSYYIDKMFKKERIGLTVNNDRYLIELIPYNYHGENSIRIVLLEHNKIKLNNTEFQYDLNIE